MTTDPRRFGLLAACVLVGTAAPSALAQTDCSFYQPPTIAFDVGEDSPGSSLGDRIEYVYELLYRCPGHGLVLTGTADSTEAEPTALAERRAANVAAEMVADGFSADRFVTVGGGVGEGRNPKRVSLEAVALEDLPGWTPRGPDHEPDPFVLELWKGNAVDGGRLRLDWTQDPDGCEEDALGSGALVLETARYGYPEQDLEVGCMRSALPGAHYVPAVTAEVVEGVTVIDGAMSTGRDAQGVGWLVGPSKSIRTDGQFCARYTAAYGEVLRALTALGVSPDDADAEAAVGAAVDALWPFADAVTAIGGDVEQVMGLDCRQVVFYEQAH